MYLLLTMLLFFNTSLFSCFAPLKNALGLLDGTPEESASYLIKEGKFKKLEKLLETYPLLKNNPSLYQQAVTQKNVHEKEYRAVYGKSFCGRFFLFLISYGGGIYLGFTHKISAESFSDYATETVGLSAPIVFGLYQFYLAVSRSDSFKKYVGSRAIITLFNQPQELVEP